MCVLCPLFGFSLGSEFSRFSWLTQCLVWGAVHARRGAVGGAPRGARPVVAPPSPGRGPPAPGTYFTHLLHSLATNCRKDASGMRLVCDGQRSWKSISKLSRANACGETSYCRYRNITPSSTHLNFFTLWTSLDMVSICKYVKSNVINASSGPEH